MNHCIFDVKRQRGENAVHSYDEQTYHSHPTKSAAFKLNVTSHFTKAATFKFNVTFHFTKADTFSVQRMNYCIFDVKRQRGENSAHSYDEQTHYISPGKSSHKKRSAFSSESFPISSPNMPFSKEYDHHELYPVIHIQTTELSDFNFHTFLSFR